MKKSKASYVSETNIGIYVWRLPDGSYLADGLDILSKTAVRGDIKAMGAISRAAAYHGYPDGTPEFQEGFRKISDEEFLIQLDRARKGLIPDTQDIGNYQDEMRYQ